MRAMFTILVLCVCASASHAQMQPPLASLAAALQPLPLFPPKPQGDVSAQAQRQQMQMTSGQTTNDNGFSDQSQHLSSFSSLPFPPMPQQQQQQQQQQQTQQQATGLPFALESEAQTLSQSLSQTVKSNSFHLTDEAKWHLLFFLFDMMSMFPAETPVVTIVPFTNYRLALPTFVAYPGMLIVKEIARLMMLSSPVVGRIGYPLAQMVAPLAGLDPGSPNARALGAAMTRNIRRFGVDFMWQLAPMLKRQMPLLEPTSRRFLYPH